MSSLLFQTKHLDAHEKKFIHMQITVSANVNVHVLTEILDADYILPKDSTPAEAIEFPNQWKATDPTLICMHDMFTCAGCRKNDWENKGRVEATYWILFFKYQKVCEQPPGSAVVDFKAKQVHSAWKKANEIQARIYLNERFSGPQGLGQRSVDNRLRLQVSRGELHALWNDVMTEHLEQ